MESDLKAVERRASAARLSLCLALLCLAFAAVSPSARAATAPASPKLLGTNPASAEGAPASTTTPLVFGEAEPEDGIILQGVRPPSLRVWGVAAAVSKPTQNPDYEILIYDQPGCSGTVISRGRADAFEEAGIQVQVAANAVTVLSAAQIDPASPATPSDCSGPMSYWEGNVPSAGEGGPGGGGSGGGASSTPAPGAGAPGTSVGPAVTTGKPEPPRLHLGPAAVANNNTPVVSGSAPGAGSVALYANGSCGGKAVASGSASQLAAGFAMSVADNTATTYSAVAVGGKRSDCSAPVTYVEDSTAPVTRVTMGPGVKTRKRKAVLRFADVTEAAPGTSSFLCKVGKAKWKPCASPLRLQRLRLRKYVVRVRAVDLAGNAERRGVKRIFKVVPPS